jgi:CRP/FNR family transcriptional regulator, cyclic AMP receptor protein
VVAILGPGHFFGEGCLNGHPLRIATTRAVDECVITRLEKATMIATIHNEPEFSELFMSYLLTRNSRIEEDLIDQLFNSSEKRLARLLLLLANFGKEGKPEPIAGKFSQETLAEMIGTTRSRVSFFMNKFRKLGFIEYNGNLEVHNSLLNVVLYDQPAIKPRDVSTPPLSVVHSDDHAGVFWHPGAADWPWERASPDAVDQENDDHPSAWQVWARLDASPQRQASRFDSTSAYSLREGGMYLSTWGYRT